jgi:hypothetical protein
MPWFGGILDFYINKVVFTITGANFKPCLSIDNVVFKKNIYRVFFFNSTSYYCEHKKWDIKFLSVLKNSMYNLFQNQKSTTC